MAFDDFRRVMEDTIRVDMKKRWTPQLVKFINNKNEFYGFFNGEISATGGFLSDVCLSNITIYKPDGSELDIDEVIEMRDRLDEYDIRFMNLSTVVSVELPAEINSKIKELSVEVYDSISKLSGEFFEKIQNSNEEIYETITDVSNLISSRIDNVEANLLSNKIELKDDISKLNEKVDQKVDEIYLSIDTFEQNTKNEFE